MKKRYYKVGDRIVMLSSELSFGVSEGIAYLKEKYPQESVKSLTKEQVEQYKKLYGV